MSQFHNPVNIIESVDFVQDVKQAVDRIGAGRMLVICSKRFAASEQFAALHAALGELHSFTDIEENPSFMSCDRAIAYAHTVQPDVLIAIGGGSVLDTAKAVRMALYKQKNSVVDLLESQAVIKKPVPFIAVPTTHGTGSEVTMWATVWNKQTRTKHSLSEECNYPDYAVFDAALLDSLPLFTSIVSTLDAFSHSFEALWNKNANPTSDTLAMNAINVIVEHISGLTHSISGSVRQHLMQASRDAGLAFSNTKTAAAHSISYPLTMHYDVPHGIACSMPLASLLRINMKAIPQKLCHLDGAIATVYASIKQHVPFTLGSYGIKQQEIEELAGLCYTKDRMENNIVDLTKEDVVTILREML